MEAIIQEIQTLVGANVFNLIIALLILVFGWLVALILAAVLRSALRKTSLDNRIAGLILGEDNAKGLDVERWTAKGAFYFIMLFVLVAFFQALGLTLITEPLNELLNRVFQYAPRLLGAGILMVVAWTLARVLRSLITRVSGAAKLDERLGEQVGVDEDRLSLSKTVAEAVYWLVFLLFLPAILSTLALEGLLRPVQDMLNTVLGYLPNLFAALLILAIGWFIARIVQRLVGNLLSAIGADQFSEKTGLSAILGSQQLSRVIGMIVYVLILIPVMIAALNTLELQAVSEPASNMLNTILSVLPLVFAAGLVLIIAYAVGRVASKITTDLLTGAGFNTILIKLNIAREINDDQRSPSGIAGAVVLIAIMLFAVTEAFNLLGFDMLAGLVVQVMIFGAQVLFGAAIFAIGLFLAHMVSQKIKDSGLEFGHTLAMFVRVAILIFSGAIALAQMGLAHEIISMTFLLILGAAAVAAAIAFGLGGREVAARHLEEWVAMMKNKES